MRNAKSGKKTVLRVSLYLAVIIICLITLYPYFVTICTALKSRAEIFAASGTVFPVAADLVRPDQTSGLKHPWPATC